MKLEKGQVAVVTGAASGIGLALARAFAQRGLNVVVCDLHEESLQKALVAIQAKDAAAFPFAGDVGDATTVEQMRDTVLEKYGRVDVVCNNAGIAIAGKALWEYDENAWQKIVHVDLWGVVNGIRTFAPLFVKQGHGHIVNTASLAGVGTVTFNGIYNACKHAVVSLTESMRAEMDERGINVGTTVLCPGLVRTNIGSAGQGENTPRAEPSEHETQGAEVLDADVCAERTLAAIEADKLHAFPNGNSGAMIRKRIMRLLEDVDSR